MHFFSANIKVMYEINRMELWLICLCCQGLWSLSLIFDLIHKINDLNKLFK